MNNEHTYGTMMALDTGARLRAATAHEAVAFATAKGSNGAHWLTDADGNKWTLEATEAQLSAAREALAKRVLPEVELPEPEPAPTEQAAEQPQQGKRK